MFDLYTKIKEEVKNFYEDKIVIAGEKKNPNTSKQFKDRGDSGYTFNQYQMLDLIDLYYNSRFESGEKDSEGYNKLFLNVVRFSCDVSIKQTDVDIKDFLFVPEDGQSEWPAYFLKKDFRQWAKDNQYGELINKLNIDRNKYGTCVIKIVRGIPERIPLKHLITPQDCRTLKEAFANGESIIQCHEMTYYQIMKQKWDKAVLDSLPKFKGKRKVYERYGLIPESLVYENGNPENMILGLVICGTADEQEKLTNDLFFVNEIKEKDFPYDESHFDKQDGRWLGIGRVERQIQNQIARNTIVNLRRRALLWSSKKIFQSTDDTLKKNLVRDVKDGDILAVSRNGQITSVDMASRTIGEFNSFVQEWQQVSDRDGFDFESATGEALPSGTPFRLGVLMSNAVQNYFDLKREEYAFFLKRVINNFLIPVFIQQTEDHNLVITSSEDEFMLLREAIIENETHKAVVNNLLNTGMLVLPQQIRPGIEQQIDKNKNLIFSIRRDLYENINYKVDYVITNESMDIKTKVETLTNLLQTTGGSETLIRKILALTGENAKLLMGNMQPQAPQQASQTKPKGNSLNDLANSNAPDRTQSAL